MPHQSTLDRFRPDPSITYLNSATYGLAPDITVDQVRKALVAWQHGTGRWIEDWDLAGEACRRSVAEMMKASTDEIALMPAVSAGAAIVASAVPAGGEVLVASGDFTSVLYPFLEAERRGNLTVREAPLSELAEAVGPQTCLVAVSHVQSADGALVDLEAVCTAARRVGARVFLDTSQSLGVVPFDVDRPEVDFVACAAYKWLCCPRGVAFLYVRRELWDEPSALFANWRAGDDAYGRYYGTPLRLAPTAARFDVSLAWHAWVGARSSLDVLAEIDEQDRFALANGAARRFAEQLDLALPEAGIVSVSVADGAVEGLERAGVVSSSRAGKVRLSFHFYNTLEQADRVADLLKPFVSTRRPSA